MTGTMHQTSRDDGQNDHIDPLRGRPLRFVLLDHLMATGQSTVAEMVALVTDLGYDLDGRASKIISDALRWEVRRHRVVRVSRGVYRYRSAPTSTARRVRLFAERCHRWITATRLGTEPPPTPADPRPAFGVDLTLAHDPPWRHLGWLWVT